MSYNVYQPRRQGMPAWAWVVVILGGLMFLTCAGCAGIIWFATSAELHADADLYMGEEFTVGEEFEIEVVVWTTNDKSQRLDSIDIDHTLLKGITVLSSEPPWSRKESIFSFTSYYFTQRIPADGPLTVVFKARAENAGSYHGSLDVCIGTSFQYIPIYVGLSIAE